MPKKGPRLGICTAKAGSFPPTYVLEVHNKPVLPLLPQPLPCPPCRVLGAKTHRPTVPSRVTQTASPGRWLFLVFRTLRWPLFCPPFFGDFLCGRVLRVLPILRTAVPPSLSSAKMSLARRQLNCCRRNSLRLASLPRTGFCLGWCPPPSVTGGDLHTLLRALLCQVPRRHQGLLHWLPYDQVFLPGPAWPFRMHCFVCTQLHGPICRGETGPPMANLYAMTPIPCCRQPPKQALQRLSRPQRPYRSTLLAVPKFLQAGLAVTLHRASRGLTLTGVVPQSLCATWPNPFFHTHLPHLCYSQRRYRASRKGGLSVPSRSPGSRGNCRFPHLCHRRLQGPCHTACYPSSAQAQCSQNGKLLRSRGQAEHPRLCAALPLNQDHQP